MLISSLFELTPQIVALLVLAAFFAGLIDAIAGGGGLITLPALLLVGASPIEALATNKLQSVFGSATATLSYAAAGHLRLRDALFMALSSLIASICGALIAHLVPLTALRLGMPVVLIGVALFFILKPGIGDSNSVRRLSPAVFTLTVVPIIAAYDGVLGPGTGSFFMLAFVMLAGFGAIKATAHTKLLNFASNLGALVVFMFSGALWWGVGLAMPLGQILGAALGARIAVRVGAPIIKPLLVVVSATMALRLLWQAFVG